MSPDDDRLVREGGRDKKTSLVTSLAPSVVRARMSSGFETVDGQGDLFGEGRTR